MGYILMDHDIYVGTLQEQVNLRFAPRMETQEGFGGLEEMVALQKEFQIFKEGRRFATSMAVLNLTSGANPQTKHRLHEYLHGLRGIKSNVTGQSGDVAIVRALMANLSAKKPLPVYFAVHDMNAAKDAKRVIITARARPLFYMDQDYLVISLPLAARAPAAP